MTDYKSMFEQAVRTLAAIDEALGIGDDGCGDPDQTLTAIEELKAAKGNRLVNGVVDTPQEQEHVATVQCVRGVTIGYLEKMLPVGTKLYTAQPAQQPLSQWIKTADQMPPSGQTVLVSYLNANGLPRRVRAQWIAPKSSESGSESDIGEYDEVTDTYYDPEGWYEQIDNWDTYSAVGICGVEVTHWMSMPPEPAHGIGGEKP